MSKLKKFYIVLAGVAVFYLGVQVGLGKAEVPVVSKFVDRNRERVVSEVDWQLLWDAIAEINKKYVDKPVDPLKILYGAIQGAVASLDDPYSVFLPPQQAADFQDELKGNFEGIGAEIAVKHQQLVVVSPLDDSPAERAGLRPGDFIFKVDGAETKDLTLEEAVQKIRGTAGTKVKLTVFHKGESEPKEIEITRAKIIVKSIEAEIKEVRGKKLGQIKMRRFGDDTPKRLDEIISNLLLQDVDGVILDLRNNPGGFLDTAVEVASNWVSLGETVVIQKFSDSRQEIFKSNKQPRLEGLPTVVLVNGGSASASEIVAGALRDHKLATLVGEKTFGKGSVQELIDLEGGSDLKLTVAKWLTPAGHDLNKEGLEPDIKVELTDEDFDKDLDPQLDKALDLLTQ